MIIAIEGLDGIGKTTLAREIASKYGFPYFKGGGWKPDSPWGRRFVREVEKPKHFSRSLYFEGIQRRFLHEAETMAKEEKTVVADRMLLVSAAHWLSRTWDEAKKDFSDEGKATALELIRKYLPENVTGIVLDVEDRKIIETRLRHRIGEDERAEIRRGAEVPREEFSCWLRENGFLGEADTLDFFEVRRNAWLWCAKQIDWEVIDASGSTREVFGQVESMLDRQGIYPEGNLQAAESFTPTQKEARA
ncbi:MAG TPA: hypothetical protein VMW04_03640 [Patescibacteria group bacterium]|nr:hypothetical protein [Patescibacteria group bacterium]